MISIDVDKLALQMRKAGLTQKALARCLDVSEKTVQRMISTYECSDRNLAKLCEQFGVERTYFSSSKGNEVTEASEAFLGIWHCSFFEGQGGKLALVTEVVEIFRSDGKLCAEYKSDDAPGERRIQVFDKIEAFSDYLSGETSIKSWLQPLGRSVFLLKILPNRQIMNGHILFIDDVRAEIFHTPYVCIRSDCEDPYFKNLKDLWLEKYIVAVESQLHIISEILERSG